MTKSSYRPPPGSDTARLLALVESASGNGSWVTSKTLRRQSGCLGSPAAHLKTAVRERLVVCRMHHINGQEWHTYPPPANSELPPPPTQPEEDPIMTVVQRIVPAAEAPPPPTTAVSSVFGLAGANQVHWDGDEPDESQPDDEGGIDVDQLPWQERRLFLNRPVNPAAEPTQQPSKPVEEPEVAAQECPHPRAQAIRDDQRGNTLCCVTCGMLARPATNGRGGLIWSKPRNGEVTELDAEKAEAMASLVARSIARSTEAATGHIASSPRPFACAVFSDGRLVLEIGGVATTLSADEARTLVRYLDRMADEEVAS